MLQRGDECQLDALAALVAGLGSGGFVGGPVGVRLQEDGLGDRLTEILWIGARRCILRRRFSRLAALGETQARVGSDGDEPGSQRAALLKSAQTAPCPEQRLLERIVGIVDGAEQA